MILDDLSRVRVERGIGRMQGRLELLDASLFKSMLRLEREKASTRARDEATISVHAYLLIWHIASIIKRHRGLDLLSRRVARVGP